VNFDEANSVRDFVRDALAERDVQFVPAAELPRSTSDVLLSSRVRDALIRLNPEIEEDPERAELVLHRLRAIILSARDTGLLAANEEFAAWLKGERSMPFGPEGRHATVRLVDFDSSEASANQWIVSTEVTFVQGMVERRFDLVLWCNGIPLAVGEAKSPVRPAYSWLDAAVQIADDYEKNVPTFFVPNVLSFGTEGKEFRYGSVGMPGSMWGPWREEPMEGKRQPVSLAQVRVAIDGVLSPAAILDFLRFFTLFATDSKHRKIKVIARYQQYQGANAILTRVALGQIRKGLIWHFQGSGKSLLIVFAALKLRAAKVLANPTVLIIVDRIDLDAQITATFNAADVPNLVSTDSRAELQRLLRDGARKVIITTIHKFGEAAGVLDDRSNIIVLVDEAHRTQEGGLGRKMREAMPNAFLFGLTGTPINTRDRNTFWAFGEESDAGGYLSRYSFHDSIRDGATLKLHFEPRLTEIRIDQEGLDAAFEELAGRDDVSDADKAALSKRAASLEHLIKAPDRVAAVAADVVSHFQEKVEPEGFKAQLVVYDKQACVMYKDALDQILPTEASAVVMSLDARDQQDWKDRFALDRDAESKLLDRYRDPADPLKILIVTAKLLTGFDAPILQTQYLDKPLRNHTLLQAICRTNRTYPCKTHGLIVDYLGIFDDVAKSLLFDDASVQRVITNISELAAQVPSAMAACLAFFPDVDRTASGWQALTAAQERLRGDAERDAFARAFSVLSQLWEALSPDAVLNDYAGDYRWLTAVYESIRPSDLTGKLVWHALGPKTLELINQHVTVDVPRSDLETIVLDAVLIEELSNGSPAARERRADEVTIEISARLARHPDDPVFIALGQRLTELKDRYAAGQQASVDFLTALFELARDTVAAEKAAAEVPREAKGKAALTELFESVKSTETPIIVERVVSDIDRVVSTVRFPGWQTTSEGDREVRKVLRQTLYLTYKLRDQDVYDRAYEYVREYY
jgi:type I restriction enzyme, R subunit